MLNKEMHVRTYLQQDETKTDTLDGIKYTKPQPKGDTQVWSCVAGPGDIERKGRGTPQHLTPTRCTETDGEDRQQPSVRFAEVRKDSEHHCPDTNEEAEDEK